jgi:SRSO17 transposase
VVAEVGEGGEEEEEEEEEAGGEEVGGVGRDCEHQAWTHATACSRDNPVMSARRRTGAWPSIVVRAEEEEEVVAAREDQV